MLEITFSALSPGQTEVPRRALVMAVQPTGSPNVVMLVRATKRIPGRLRSCLYTHANPHPVHLRADGQVSGSTSSNWKKAEPALRAMAKSFRVERVRPTSIARKSKNDYRFEDQGGLNERTSDSVNNLF